MTQSSTIPKSQWSNYRPIAPLLAPQKIMPRSEQVPEKRKWDTLDDSELSSKHNERRGSGSSQGSNSSANLAVDQRLRRKEQNRAAQRAFRERKERYVKELEEKIKAIEEAHAIKVEQLEKENERLKNAMKEMKAEMFQLKESSPSTSSSSPLTTFNQSPALESTSSIHVDSQSKTSPILSNNNNNSGGSYSNNSNKDNNSTAFTQSLPSLSLSLSPASPSPLLQQSKQPQEDLMEIDSNNNSINIDKRPNKNKLAYTPSAVECIRDKDGVSFCERLKEEVCYSAYEQLVSEPLFDSQGILNDSVSSHPVPIVTSPISPKEDDDENSNSSSNSSSHNNNNNHDKLPNAEIFDRLQKSLTTKTFNASDNANGNHHLISCSQVWRELAAHPLFNQFDHELLCNELKKRARCSNSGPVFCEEDIKEVLDIMEKAEKAERAL